MTTVNQAQYTNSRKGKVPSNLSLIHLKQKLYGHPSKGKTFPQISGSNHWAWKGDKVSYRSLHRWVERQLGKADHCENDISHISSRYHWANISKCYKRDVTDWKQLCPKCNWHDGRRVKIRQ